MRIGEVADRSGLSVDAIRFYERKGVLERPERTAAGYRIYGPGTIERLALVGRLQALGLTLDEIAEALGDGRHVACESESWRLGRSLERVNARIDELAEMRSRLESALRDCEAGRCGIAGRC